MLLPKLKTTVLGLLLIAMACCHGAAQPTKHKNNTGVPEKSPEYIVAASAGVAGRIIGGEFAEGLGDVPWQVMLMEEFKFICGGSLISGKWALTAAHCVEKDGFYTIRLGSLTKNYFEEGSVEMDIRNIIIHPGYATKGYDIALIKLPVTIVLPVMVDGEIFINAIRLPKSADVAQTHVGRSVLASGWGKKKVKSGSTYLKKLSLTVISNAECADAGARTNIEKWHICVDDIDKNRSTATCNGDSGGPVAILGSDDLYTLLGVISFGSGDNTSCFTGPHVFTRVAFFLDWIKKNTGRKV